MAKLNGCEVTQEWLNAWQESQEEVTLEVCGFTYKRIRLQMEQCWECYATSGQLHIIGCDREICPVCDGELVQCECFEESNDG